MSGAIYDDDIYAWSQEQAALLRDLARDRQNLPNGLDLEHVAEEIEDVGRAEIRTVESFLELIFRHLLKMASAPEAPAVRHWRHETSVQHRALRKDLKRSMFGLIDPDEIWDAALGRADADLTAYGDALLPGLPKTCPFTLEEMRGPLDVDAALDRLAAAATPVSEPSGPR